MNNIDKVTEIYTKLKNGLEETGLIFDEGNSVETLIINALSEAYSEGNKKGKEQGISQANEHLRKLLNQIKSQ